MAGVRAAARAAGLVLLYYGFSIGITFYNKWLMKVGRRVAAGAGVDSGGRRLTAWPPFRSELRLPAVHDAAAPAGHLRALGAGQALLPPPPRRPRRRPRPPALARLPAPGGPDSALHRPGRGAEQLELPLHHGLPRAALVLVVLLIAGGLFLFTYKATQFDAEGFAMVLAASFLGGVRWTRTQILLQKDELGLQNPIDTMFHLQPAMFLSLFPLFAVFEGLPLSASEKLFRFHEGQLLLELLGKLVLGGVLAFGLGFSEFLLVSRTSSLTFSISGIFKEVFTLFLAAHLMGDQLSPLNWLGFAVCLLGISLHVALKALGGPKGTKHLEGPGSAADLELLLLLDSPEEEAENAPLH